MMGECSLGFGCMSEEHEGWKDMCKVIQEIFGITPEEFNENKYRPLAKSIEKWGLALVRLRIHQKEEHKDFNEDWLFKGAFN